MSFYYSTNRNVQLLIALLKAHGIKRIIASPGTTNLELMASLQSDDFFEMYSCVDERSAAYMACGLATETGEPVVITCTEATASRNYYPGITEAYHRKLPILAITGLHDYTCIGNLEPQVIDRSVSPMDSFKCKVNLPVIKDLNDENESVSLINKAILELYRHGGGPVHINMPWGGGNFDFSVQNLPTVRVLRRYCQGQVLPKLQANKVAVLIGAHKEWSEEETYSLEAFCRAYNAVAFCDHSSKFYGEFRVQSALLAMQRKRFEIFKDIDLLIHIGEESVDDNTRRVLREVKEVWRVSPDGEIRDTFKKLSNVFEMSENAFFDFYTSLSDRNEDSYREECFECKKQIDEMIPELPFSSIFVASRLAPALPKDSVIHFGLSDSIRAWSMFDLPNSVRTSCNAGCRGIDGCLSALVGASLANKNKLYFAVVGDLTFFYDLNILGNRHLGNNVRILVVNNDGGNIFRHNGHPSQSWLGYENANLYIAAGGHFGNKSPKLVKDMAENLGFEYLKATNKEEFEEAYLRFVTPQLTEKPMLFEIFTNCKEDSDAFSMMENIALDAKDHAKEAIKQIIGEQGTAFVKRLIKK